MPSTSLTAVWSTGSRIVKCRGHPTRSGGQRRKQSRGFIRTGWRRSEQVESVGAVADVTRSFDPVRLIRVPAVSDTPPEQTQLLNEGVQRGEINMTEGATSCLRDGMRRSERTSGF
jgi:hypothetical protein